MSIKSSATLRTLERGETHRLDVSFFTDETQQTPLVSKDLTQFPSYIIFNVENNSVSHGVGTYVSAGNWYAIWMAPEDALLSTDDTKYRIEWTFLDENDKQFSFVQEFDVVDSVIQAASVPVQKITALVNKEFRFVYRTQVIPYDIDLTVFFGTNETTPVISGATLKGGDLKKRNEDVWQVFYYDAGKVLFDQPGCYTALWGIQTSEMTPMTYDHQLINVIPMSLLQFIPSVRMVIDKMQKRLNTIQAYQDTDIIEYLMRGLQFINGWFPVTYYCVNNIPAPLQTAWIMASSWYGLQAQHLLNVELQYEFSGQIDSFSFDHASGISDVLARIWDYFTTQLGPMKQQLFRTSHRVGANANRIMSFRGNYGQQIVFNLGTGGIQNQLPGNFIVFFGL